MAHRHGGGRAREARAEFENVFSRAGFRVNRVITTAGPLAMIEAAVGS